MVRRTFGRGVLAMLAGGAAFGMRCEFADDGFYLARALLPQAEGGSGDA